ncbi:NAD(P)/FAD-dependent oxidoreductase [Vallicoccus soli]|uniref:NAD(P)/FAD-dependent oxidoreductase n=1 Tax=Vallicoccus soli TaxID=2339232 RepID=A0A3A3Z004_9ACTN|nr:FAD-dependent oxidoreductase [Vallicoccus soli]RJK97560.1 NAD(P)/FAD-dependent oxidoreductase [Vallicoccus soli]
MSADRPQVVVVGGGFAGFHALRRLQRDLAPGTADLVLVNPTDYLLYSPLLPEVATGVVEARHVAVSLRRALPRVRLVLGRVEDVDLQGRAVRVARSARAGGSTTLRWDRLALAPGSVTRQPPVPGVPEHGRGLKTLVEAVFLRDHLLEQLDLADATPDTPAGRAERAARLTVVAVGAGYTGTEVVAQTQRWLRRIEGRWSRTRAQDVRWVLVDVAPAVLPELGAELGRRALALLRRRGVDVRLEVSVAHVDEEAVRLTDGTTVPTRTLLWGAGVVPNPLVGRLGLPLRRGRLVVEPDLSVPGAPHVWAAGDAAAVPDLALAEGPQGRSDTPPTAQHAQRQGVVMGRNIAASLTGGRARTYCHRDLGLVADLGGWDAVAKPLGIPLTGPLAKAVARGYHLYALPSTPNRVRVAADWLFQALLPPESTQLSVVRADDARVAVAQGLLPPQPSGPDVAGAAPRSPRPAPAGVDSLPHSL